MGSLERRTPDTTPTMKGSPTRPTMGGVQPTCMSLSPAAQHGHPSTMHQVAPPLLHQPPRFLGSQGTPALLQHSTLLLHHHGGLLIILLHILHSLLMVHHHSTMPPPCLRHGGTPTHMSLRQPTLLHHILPQHLSMRSILGNNSYATCNLSTVAPRLPLNGLSSGHACNPSLPFVRTCHWTVFSQMASLSPPRRMPSVAMPSTSYLLVSSVHLPSTSSTTTSPFVDADLNC